MSSAETSPGRLALWGAGASGGAFGGGAVGVGEALHVLSSTTPGEYQALLYGAVLYGGVGAVGGAAVGAVVALLAPRRSRAFLWSAGFSSVTAVLGGAVLVYLLDRVWFGERGLPTGARALLGGGLATFVLLGLWLGTVILTKTPLRVLPGLKGSVAAAAGALGLLTLFSLSPAPGAVDERTPRRPQPPEAAARPDVIVVVVDALRADALGVYGAPADATPRLDAFAADAVVFEQAIAHASWTRPSVASLFSSLLPSAHTCTRTTSSLPEATVTLAEVLRDSGYATGGLPNNPHITGAFGFAQGFDWYPYAQVFPFGARESSSALSLHAALRRLRAHLDPLRRVEDAYLPAETQLLRAEEWLEAQGDDRAFLFVHLMDPHDPYFTRPLNGEGYDRATHPAPGADEADRLRALYAGEVAHVDAQLGAFFDRLRASGRYDRSLIVVTADHGEEFFEHGGWWHGTSLYDELIRVPLLVKLPLQARGGTRVPWQVRHLDVAPTVAELANVAPSDRWGGVTLFSDDFDEMLGRSLPPPPDDDPDAPVPPPFVPPTWANHPASREAIAELDFDGLRMRALRVEGRKVAEVLQLPRFAARAPPEVTLFSLLDDPGETVNHADGAAETVYRAWLERRVDEARAEAVVPIDRSLGEAERERLRALGYLPGGG